MKITQLIVFGILLLAFACRFNAKSDAVEVKGGKLMDVVVRSTGNSDSTFMIDSTDMCPVGPSSFDVDKNGNIYVLEWLLERVQRFNKNGIWLGAINVHKEDEQYQLRNIVVDNWGNIYVNRAESILKFSPQGRFLFRAENQPNSFPLSVDSAGRIYQPDNCIYDSAISAHINGIYIYSPELKLEKIIKEYKEIYIYNDRIITQKEAGNDIYYRQDKYLMRTSSEEYIQTGKIDTVAILPDELRMSSLREGPQKSKEEDPDMIGFDRDTCFYFDWERTFYEDSIPNICTRYQIGKYCLRKGELTKAGEVWVEFFKSSEECSFRKSLCGRDRRFLVSGDGTIYWLHGTVDTVKVSKIIFDK